MKIYNNKLKSILTIAGSDSGGGAGIQADIKTFSSIGVHGVCVITSITSQNTMSVDNIYNLPNNIIENQLKSILKDFSINYIKIGMLSSIEIVQHISSLISKYHLSNIILDPVMVSESGSTLLDFDAISILKKVLLPKIDIITPNIFEAEVLSNIKIKSIDDMKKSAFIISNYGVRYVIIKGGHLDGTDILYDSKNCSYISYKYKYINSKKGYHGTGCTFSSSLASYLSIGYSIEIAFKLAKLFVYRGILNSKNLLVGNGSIPLNQSYYLFKYQEKCLKLLKKRN